MRLLNSIFEDENFLVDDESFGYIVRDIINMNWWNTCGYLLGYQKNRRKSLDLPTKKMKLMGIILKEFYRYRQNNFKNSEKFIEEIKTYIETEKSPLRQLKLFSMNYRRNESQYFYKNGKPTWLDCTSRATYAWKYIGQNGYLDYDNKIRVNDGNIIKSFCKNESVYPFKNEIIDLFEEGENAVKKEIFSQKTQQNTVAEWIDKLNIKILPSRVYIFDRIANVKTDPFKNNEKKLLKEKMLFGNNETLYGFSTMASFKKTSHESRASRASNAGDASAASSASHASRASDANAITTKNQTHNWFDVKTAIGELKGLEHPHHFKKNKFGLAGHWKIDRKLLNNFKGKNWFDPFAGHGESALYAKKNKINYYGIEINKDSMRGYILPYIQKSLDDFGDKNINVKIELGDSSLLKVDLIDCFDLCYTSPPYFDFEDYGFHNKKILESKSYNEYHENVTIPIFKNVKKYLKKDGLLAIQTEKNKKFKNLWIETMQKIGFKLINDKLTGLEENKYSVMSKRDQNLIIFEK